MPMYRIFYTSTLLISFVQIILFESIKFGLFMSARVCTQIDFVYTEGIPLNMELIMRFPLQSSTISEAVYHPGNLIT